MSEKIRVGFVGCGGIARRHLGAWMELQRHGIDTFEIVAACDPREESLETFAAFARDRWGLEPVLYRDLERMLKEARIRAADICTTHASHHLAAEACMESGVDVMVEKPLGATVRASRRIIETAERTGRTLAVAENIRRSLGMRTARWLLQDRRILGDPLMFFVQQAGFAPQESVPPAMIWRLQRLQSGGFYAIDSGAHFLDGVRYLFGDVESVFARTLTLDPTTFEDFDGNRVVSDVEDSFTAILNFRSGLVGTWSFSRALPGEPFRRVLYYGSEGSIEDQADVMHGFQRDSTFKFRDGSERTLQEYEREYLLTIDPEERNRLFPGGITDGVAVECFDFIDAVRTGRKPEVDGWEGLRAKAIADAIYESSTTGRAVRIDDVIEGRVEEYQRPINEALGI